MADAEVVPGDRGGLVLVCNGYRYHLHKRNKDTMRWRCWRKECRAPLVTNVFDLQEESPEVIQQDEHDHGVEDRQINRAEVRDKLKRKIADNPTAPTRRLFADTLAESHRQARQGGGDRPEFPRFDSIRSQLERHKRSFQPEIPVNVNDVVIEGPWAETWMEDLFLLNHGHGQEPCDWGCAIFATEENLRTLRNCSTVYMDATFKCCPQPYTQFFTILGLYHGRTLPLVNCLMEARTTGHYRHVLQVVKQNVRRVTHHTWRPREIICDFEQGLITAVETDIRRTRVSACYFHFTQSLWRRVQELGLSNGYRRDRRLKKCIRKIMALGYLPLALVRQNFRMYTRERSVRRLTMRFPALDDWLNYVRGTYIDGQFEPVLWNVYQRNMDTRTNNNIENYHRNLNDRVGVRHPSLWVFIRHLKDQQSTTESNIDGAERGEPRPLRRRKWRQVEDRLRQLKREYDAGDRTLTQYWNAVRYHFGNF